MLPNVRNFILLDMPVGKNATMVTVNVFACSNEEGRDFVDKLRERYNDVKEKNVLAGLEVGLQLVKKKKEERDLKNLFGEVGDGVENSEVGIVAASGAGIGGGAAASSSVGIGGGAAASSSVGIDGSSGLGGAGSVQQDVHDGKTRM